MRPGLSRVKRAQVFPEAEGADSPEKIPEVGTPAYYEALKNAVQGLERFDAWKKGDGWKAAEQRVMTYWKKYW